MALHLPADFLLLSLVVYLPDYSVLPLELQ